MKKLVTVYMNEDGGLGIEVTPILGMAFDSKEELFESFDSELIVDEVQNLINTAGEKIGITK